MCASICEPIVLSMGWQDSRSFRTDFFTVEICSSILRRVVAASEINSFWTQGVVLSGKAVAMLPLFLPPFAPARDWPDGMTLSRVPSLSLMSLPLWKKTHDVPVKILGTYWAPFLVGMICRNFVVYWAVGHIHTIRALHFSLNNSTQTASADFAPQDTPKFRLTWQPNIQYIKHDFLVAPTGFLWTSCHCCYF